MYIMHYTSSHTVDIPFTTVNIAYSNSHNPGIIPTTGCRPIHCTSGHAADISPTIGYMHYIISQIADIPPPTVCIHYSSSRTTDTPSA